ncbi:MAG: Elongation factor P [bacterium]|nr:elongation factor P [bacterium]MBK7493880.1 elongation factor P [Candidatus Omnitrophota bacterium]MBV6481705.1 Elongation factor P [bacterium]MCE7907881.1 elongation factor P [Candidatus Omnitrophica bacterium COP1]
MISVNNLRRGLLVEVEGTVYAVVEYQHHKPGKGHAIVRVKLKNAQTGAVIDRTFNGKEKIPLANAQRKKMQFLYNDDQWHFMDQVSYEQVALSADEVDDAANYLTEGLEVEILFNEGRPLAIDLPSAVVLKVTYSEPGLKGDTATGATKKATVETGYVIDVPLFINEGDMLKIDTRTGDYLERAR